MMRKIVLLLCLLVSVVIAKGQTTLNSGDIAFVGINSDGPDDQFAFLLLTDIASGTQIRFTDSGWNHSTGFNLTDAEGFITWTATSAMTAGTVVTITTYNSNFTPTANNGVITGDKMLISIAGDQVFAFQGTIAAPVFIAGISFNQNSLSQPGNDFDGASTTNSTTALPEGLTMGLNAVHIYKSTNFAEQDDSRYAGINSGSKSALLKSINNRTNWEMNDNTPYLMQPFVITFSVSAPTLAISATTGAIQTKGSSVSFNITSNTTWSVTSDQSWLTISPVSGSDNATVTLTAGDNSASASRSAIVTVSASGVTAKTYTVTQAGGVVTSVDDVVTPAKVTVYPNPVKDQLHIDVDQKASVSIFAINGNQVLETFIINGSVTKDLSDLKPGYYIIVVKTDAGVTRKVLIKE